MGPGHFPKLKIPLYQKAPAISYKPLSQLHTDDLVSFDLLYKAAIPFEQANKQTKKPDKKKSWLFTRLQENGTPGVRVYYSPIKNEVLIHPTTLMNLKNIFLRKTGKKQKTHIA